MSDSAASALFLFVASDLPKIMRLQPYSLLHGTAHFQSLRPGAEQP